MHLAETLTFCSINAAEFEHFHYYYTDFFNL